MATSGRDYQVRYLKFKITFYLLLLPTNYYLPYLLALEKLMYTLQPLSIIDMA